MTHSELFPLPHQEGAGGPRAGCAVRALRLCGNAQGVCADLVLHPLGAENEAGPSASQSPDLGDMWRYGCPESLDWDSDFESWTESEGTSSTEQCEHHVESLAPDVMGQDQSGEKMSLFLEDWELGRVALSCHIAVDMLCQEMQEAWQLGCCCHEARCHSKESLFSHSGRVVTEWRRDVEWCWLVTFPSIFDTVKHGVPLERGCSFLSFEPPCCVNSSEFGRMPRHFSKA